MNSARTFARNLMANWIGHGANLVVMFYISPYIVNSLGKVDYGIWNLLVSLTGSMGLLDLGIRASTERHIILHTGRGQFNLVNDTLRASLGFFSVLGLSLLVLGLLLGRVFPSLFRDIPLEHHGVIQILLPLMAANIWMTAIGTVFSSILVAHDRYDLVQAANLGTLALRTGGTVLALRFGGGLSGLVAATLVAQFLLLAVNFRLARRTFPQMAIWPFWISRNRFRELIGYGTAAFIASVAYRVIHQVDLFVVGALTTVAMVSVYAVGAMLPEYLWGFVHQISQTFFPPIQRAFVQNNQNYVHRLYIRQARISFLIGIPLYTGILVFGGQFLRLWIGRSFTAEDMQRIIFVMNVLCVSRLVFLSGLGAASLLSAIGYIRLNAVLGVIEAVLNLSFSIAFVVFCNWGVGGVALGTLAGMILFKGILHPWYACRKSQLSLWRYFYQTILPGLITGAIFGVWCLFVRRMAPNATWLVLFMEAALSMVVYLPVAFILLVDDIDRRRILQAIGLLPQSRNNRPEWSQTLP